MTQQRPSLSQLVEQSENNLAEKLEIPTQILPTSNVSVIAKAMAGLAHELYGYSKSLVDRLFTSAEFWADIFGLTLLAATPSKAEATFTGVEGTVIPAGTEITRDSVNFSTDADATILGGTVTVACTSDEAGIETNISAGDGALVHGLTDIDSIVTFGVATGGTDQETESALYLRVLDTARASAQGGSAADYKIWISEVDGVANPTAEIIAAFPEAGWITVYLLVDGNIASQTLKTDILNYLETQKPLVANVQIADPVPVVVDFTLSLSPNSVALQQDVEDALEDYFAYTLAISTEDNNEQISLSNVSQVISDVGGEDSHTISVPTSMPLLSVGEYLQLGAITWV